MDGPKAYPIPEEVIPSDFDCITFFYPNHTWYRSALISSYEFLASWTAWKRDEAKNGKVVAQLWKQAHTMSREHNYMPPINIVINNSDSGSCGCCSTSLPSGQTIPSIPVVINPDDNLEQPEIDDSQFFTEGSGQASPPDQYVTNYPTWQEFDDQKCLASNFYAEQIVKAIDTLKNILEAGISETIGALIGAIVLAFADGPLPAGEALFISILVVPPLVNWLRDQGTDTSELVDWVLNVDVCELTEVIYSATLKSNLAQAMGDYMQAQVDSTSISPLGKQFLTAFIDFYFRNRFSDFIYDNLDNFIPADYVGSCTCGQAPANWPPPWFFPLDTQGWFAENEVNTITQWTTYPAHSTDQDNGFESTFIDTSSGGSPFSIDYSAIISPNLWTATTGDLFQVRVYFNYLFTTSRNFDVKIIYADDTFDMASFVTVGNANYNLGQVAVSAPNDGKEVKKLVVTAHSAGNDDGYFPAQGVPRIRFASAGVVFI